MYDMMEDAEPMMVMGAAPEDEMAEAPPRARAKNLKMRKKTVTTAVPNKNVKKTQENSDDKLTDKELLENTSILVQKFANLENET